MIEIISLKFYSSIEILY